MLTGQPTKSHPGTLSRVRRDSKACLGQSEYHSPCGGQAMFKVPVVGKAVRLWNGWYALCSFCGCLFKFHAHHRYESEVCCLRCHHKLLNRSGSTKTTPPAAATPTPQCRYCGKFDPQRSGVRWRLVKSPLDTSGANELLPPPLRTVHFCPVHYRSWIPSSMKQLETRVVLSHLVFGAKPCFNMTDAPEARRPAPSNRKRGRGSRR
jgi:hypothetical protein